MCRGSEHTGLDDPESISQPFIGVLSGTILAAIAAIMRGTSNSAVVAKSTPHKRLKSYF